MMEPLLVLFFIGVGVAAAILLPLFVPEEYCPTDYFPGSESKQNEEITPLMDSKKQQSDIEFEKQLGKLSEEDYHQLLEETEKEKSQAPGNTPNP